MPKLFKKSRRYPIQRDITGRSGRRRAFDGFNRGLRPSEVARKEGIKPRTAYRYFQDWKKLPENLESEYRVLRTLKKQGVDITEEIVELMSEGFGISAEDVRKDLQKPWGLKRLLMGKIARAVRK